LVIHRTLRSQQIHLLRGEADGVSGAILHPDFGKTMANSWLFLIENGGFMVV